MRYVWEQSLWPNFVWDNDKILNTLSTARKAQGYILGQSDFYNLKEQGELLVEETMSTSAIEGELFDRDSIRSSVAKRLGLATAGLPDIKRESDGLVELLLDATENYTLQLTEERLCGWQASLFPTGYSGMYKIGTGRWRDTTTPMQVISGSMGNVKIHFEAPPSKQLKNEMKRFLQWWNNPPEDLDGLIRAGIAHFWFVTIHPFEDGNGRIARAVTDMALAQDEQSSRRLYSLSSQIMKDKNNYYNILEESQKGKGDLSDWIIWFLETFIKSIDTSANLIRKSLFISNFFHSVTEINLNIRQKKVLKKLLEYFPDGLTGGLTNKKYVAMTKTSPETAKRDLKDMVEKGIILKNEAGGRSSSYRLNKEL